MPYKNLVAQICATPEEYFQRFRDFLCARNGTYDYSTTGIGWTLHDSSYAVDEDTLTVGDWFVVYSSGENGDEDMYHYFEYTDVTGFIMEKGCLYWNAATHTPVVAFPTLEVVINTLNTYQKLWIYGDLDSVSLIGSDATNYYGNFFGRTTDLLYDDTIVTSSSSVSSGTDVVITLSSVPSSWYVGQNIFIRDNDNIKKIGIKVISGNDITVDLADSFSAGCKLQADICYISGNSAQFLAGYNGLVSHGGLSGGSSLAVTPSSNNLISSTNVPDTMNNEQIAVSMHFHDTNPDGYYGRIKNILYTVVNNRTQEESLTDVDSGESYRFFNMYSLKYYMFREV